MPISEHWLEGMSDWSRRLQSLWVWQDSKLLAIRPTAKLYRDTTCAEGQVNRVEANIKVASTRVG